MKTIFFVLLITFSNRCICQKLTLDDLVRINSTNVSEVKKLIKAKGYTLTQITDGVYNAREYHFESNNKTGSNRTLFYRYLELYEFSSLDYGFTEKSEFENFRKIVKDRGFKLSIDPSENTHFERIDTYKKGKLEVNLWTYFGTGQENIDHYEVSVAINK